MATVKLISHTPDPERTVACAAKLCYSASDIDTLMDGLTDEKVHSFVDMLAEIGHESPIEHVSFTFGIEGVSRALLAQITRHRIASYSVKSQRYVTEGCFEFVTPPEIAEDPEATKIFRDAMQSAQDSYDRIAALLKERHQAAFMAQGKDEKTAARLAEKKAIEDARFVLPNACETKMVVTMNARSLFNFFRHRCCNRFGKSSSCVDFPLPSNPSSTISLPMSAKLLILCAHLCRFAAGHLAFGTSAVDAGGTGFPKEFRRDGGN